MVKVQIVDTNALGPVVSRVQSDAVLSICAAMKSIPAPLIPILHAGQEKVGFVPKDAVPLIARELNLSIAEVHGVVSFSTREALRRLASRRAAVPVPPPGGDAG
jgi:NADH:ubiquinone oxidoreductase subunit E